MIKVYTDGSALFDNRGPGGWAFVVTSVDDVTLSEKTKFFSGGHLKTTSQHMEMTAIFEALAYLKEQSIKGVTIYSDSKFSVDCLNTHIHRWMRNNFKKGKIKNIGLWKLIYGLFIEVEAKIEWVPGHSGEPFNEFCDSLALKTAKEIADGRRAKYNQMQIGDSVCQLLTDSFWAPRFVVMQRFDSSSTIILKEIGGFKKKVKTLSSQEFNEGNFLKT